MKSVTLLSAAAVAATVQASPALNARANMESITTSGNAFFKGGSRFYVRGIDYQPGGAAADVDPLADTKVCKPDIEKFKKLGINAIRVYSVDNSLNHDDCMNALADAGIYVMIDANNPKYSINRKDPHPSYNAVYLQSVFATIDAFAKYPNTMAFFSGNEVIHDEKETTLAAKYVKATDRDMRAYIKARGYRKILVGYSAADVTDNRLQTANFFNCGTEEERSDFFAFVCPLFFTCVFPVRAVIKTLDANRYGDRTITPGALLTLSPPAGTRRLRTSPAMASPSSSPSTGASPTRATSARLSPSCTRT